VQLHHKRVSSITSTSSPASVSRGRDSTIKSASAPQTASPEAVGNGPTTSLPASMAPYQLNSLLSEAARVAGCNLPATGDFKPMLIAQADCSVRCSRSMPQGPEVHCAA